MQEKSWHKIPNSGKNFHFATFLVEREAKKVKGKKNIRIIQRKFFLLFFGSSKHHLVVGKNINSFFKGKKIKWKMVNERAFVQLFSSPFFSISYDCIDHDLNLGP